MAALIGAILVATLVGTAAGHAHIAALGLATVLIVGVTIPIALVRLVTVHVKIERTRATAGDEVEFRVRCPTPFGWPTPGLVLRSPFSDEQQSLTVSVSRHERIMSFLAPRRGVYDLGQMVVSCSFPFGLLAARKLVANAGTAIIWPRPIAIELPINTRVVSIAGELLCRTGDQGDAAGVRPYRRGDSMRVIHWRQTARHDQLIVRDRSIAGWPRQLGRLDNRQCSYRNPEEFELAVRLAAGMLTVARAREAALSLSIDNAQLNITTAEDARRALDVLAAARMEVFDPRMPAGAEWVITSRQGWQSFNGLGGWPVFVEDHQREAVC